MAEPIWPRESTDTSLTLQDIHRLSREEWFRKLLEFQPSQYKAEFLRLAGKFLRALAAECDGFAPLAEIEEGKQREREERYRAMMFGTQQQQAAQAVLAAVKPTGIKSTAEIKHDVKTESARVLSMVTDEDTEK